MNNTQMPDNNNKNMVNIRKWTYDELKQAGVDYTSIEQVQHYDEMHQRFRDYEKNSNMIIELLKLDSNSTVIDMGTGTGAFTFYAAKHCRKVYAVDVSHTMLEYCRNKCENKGISNISYCHGGFLTYVHRADPADAMVSMLSLHHLPDFWKLLGLTRAARMLKPGGKLFLLDIVFPAEIKDIETGLDTWVSSIAELSGHELAAEAIIHIREEYSTYDWVMEGMLERAGFVIDSASYDEAFKATYVCTRK